MEIIRITIPDDLTPEQELLEIGKKLGKRCYHKTIKKCLVVGTPSSICKRQLSLNANQLSNQLSPVNAVCATHCLTNVLAKDF